MDTYRGNDEKWPSSYLVTQKPSANRNDEIEDVQAAVLFNHSYNRLQFSRG